VKKSLLRSAPFRDRERDVTCGRACKRLGGGVASHHGGRWAASRNVRTGKSTQHACPGLVRLQANQDHELTPYAAAFCCCCRRCCRCCCCCVCPCSYVLYCRWTWMAMASCLWMISQSLSHRCTRRSLACPVVTIAVSSAVCALYVLTLPSRVVSWYVRPDFGDCELSSSASTWMPRS